MTRVISDCLRQRAGRIPNQIAFTYLLDGDTQQVQLSYAQLHQNALTIARPSAQLVYKTRRAGIAALSTRIDLRQRFF